MKSFSYKMLVRMLAVQCDQNNSYEITMNDNQASKVNETPFIFIS